MVLANISVLLPLLDVDCYPIRQARGTRERDNFFGGFVVNFVVPSGNDCYIANWKMTIEMVNFPMKNGDFPCFFLV